jgi:hypothetical protein
MCRTFGTEAVHNAIAAMEGLRGVPRDTFLSDIGALLTSGVPDRSAPSAPKPRNAEPIAGTSTPVKQHSHASSNVSIPIRSSLSSQKPLCMHGLKSAIQAGREKTFPKAIFPNKEHAEAIHVGACGMHHHGACGVDVLEVARRGQRDVPPPLLAKRRPAGAIACPVKTSSAQATWEIRERWDFREGDNRLP